MAWSRRAGQAVLSTLVVAGALSLPVLAQTHGSVEGEITLVDAGGAVHGAVVLLVGPGLVALTDDEGRYVLDNVPVGTHEILAQREHLTAVRQIVIVEPGQTAVINFALGLSPVHEEVTVTATPGGRGTTFEAFNATTTLDSFDIVANPVGTLAAAIEDQPGIAKRGFGPGASRPIIRGFDGDRVLMMEDGVSTGDLSSQSGDHGVTIDPNGLERIEVVRGPATLLYGSNAVGGVVNAITAHETFRDSLVAGTRGQFNADGGSTNGQAGTSASAQHARDSLVLWASGGTRRTHDYNTPEGPVENSATQLSHGRAGMGYFGERFFASGGVTAENGRSGVPFAADLQDPEEDVDGADSREDVLIDIDSRRRVGRFDAGMRNLTSRTVDGFRVIFTAVDWEHDEVESVGSVESIGTAFDNRTYVVRAEVDQRQQGALSGKFGLWTKFRDYLVEGEEVLAPPTKQAAFAAFVYEELDFGQYRVQLGGRVERNAYTVSTSQIDSEAPANIEPPDARDRDFTGLSASAGVQADLGASGTLVANLTRSYRAPALEELYNFGPHVGNLLFEIGNPDLQRESTIGLDLSLRHQSQRLRGDINFYVYDIDDFVFLDIGDQVVDGLQVAKYVQGDSRFTGFDAKGSLRVGAQVWANLGIGLVDATLTRPDEALPRIPPVRGSVSLDLPYRGFTVTPELIVAAAQDKTFREETRTAGYTVVNLRASYVWPMQHMAHVLSVSAFNLTNELYRNHTSFIKDLAPEIGRGVRVGYSLRFF